MRTVGACGCSIWCCRSGARSVKCPDERCATHVADRSRDSCRPSASDVARPARGRCVAVPSAREGGSRSPRRARRSSTTRVPGRSFVRGRNAVDVGSRVRPPRSLRASFRARRSTVSCPCPGDPERAWQRGDVPARGLATELGRIWDVPVVDVLERQSRTSSSARALPRRASSQRARERERALRGRAARLRRGRRLHVRSDRRRLRVGVSSCRSAPRRGDHVRAGRPLD